VVSGTAFSLRKLVIYWANEYRNRRRPTRRRSIEYFFGGEKKHYVTRRAEKTFGLRGRRARRATDVERIICFIIIYFLSLSLSRQITWFAGFGHRNANASSCRTRPARPTQSQ